MSRIGILVLTNGRYGYCLPTIRSLLTYVYPRGPLVMFDDSGDPKYIAWLRARFPNFELYPAFRRMGVIRAFWRAFQHMIRRTDIDWVFVMPDDMVFTRPVDLGAMVEVMDRHPHLAEMALLRQPWYDVEIAAGGIFAYHGLDNFRECRDGAHSWIEQRLFFALGPMLIRRSLLAEVPYPRGGLKGERSYGQRILAAHPEMSFGIWGPLDGQPVVRHIGMQQAGYGY